MEKIGSIVSVGTKGICEIADIKQNAFEGAAKGKEYYILKPIENTNNMFIYLPTDTPLAIRKLVSKTEAKNIIDGFSTAEEISASTEEERIKAFTLFAKNGNTKDWARLLKTLLSRKEKLSKKQISGLEQKLFQSVKDCLLLELSVVLGLEKQEIAEKLAI